MVGGDAVGQTVGAAGVLGHVAADGAGALAGRVGRVIEAVLGDLFGQVQVDDAGFDDGDAVFYVDVEDAGHAGEREN